MITEIDAGHVIYDEEWHHIFDLRCDKTAHPDMRKVADMAKLIYWNTYPEAQEKVEYCQI